jgi:hypothetical protein
MTLPSLPPGMGTSMGGSALSAVGTILGGLFGPKKVKVPELKPINFEQEQQKAIQQNIASLEPATELATKTTAAEQNVLEAQLRRAIPGYDQLVQQAGKNIGSALKGELSADVAAQIQRSTAGRALSGGFGGGSGFGRALTARDLGLTSMQLQNQGLAQAQNFIQQQRTMGMVQPFSVSSMFITPNQRIGFMQQQQQAQYARDMAAAQVAAQPSAMKQAFGSAITQFTGTTGGAMFQRGLSQMAGPSSSPYSSYNPQNDPEIYSIPSTNIGGPTDPSNWA